MARPDRYRGARARCQEARVGESRDIGKACVEGLNGKREGRGERGAMEAGGKGQGRGEASVAGEINRASWWRSEQHHMRQLRSTQGQSALEGSRCGSRSRIPSSTLGLPLQK